MPARLHVAADRSERCNPLEDDLPAEEDERAQRVFAVREERPITRIGLLLRLHPADGEDHVVCLAGEEVSAAGASVDQQPDSGAAPPLDLRTIGRSRARHQRCSLLLHPAERRDVLVRAKEDPRLTRTRLRREVGLPLGETVRVACPASHVRGIPVAHRPAQHRQRKPVDLEIDDPGDLCAGDDSLSLRDPLRNADRPHVVRAKEHGEHNAHRSNDEGRKERPAEVVDCQHAVGHLGGHQEHECVGDQDQQEAEHECERQSQRCKRRRNDGVQRADDRRDDERAPEVLDVDSREDPGGNHQGDACRKPRDEQREDSPAGALGLPCAGSAVLRAGFVRHRALLPHLCALTRNGAGG